MSPNALSILRRPSRLFYIFATRPRLLIALGVGLAVAAAMVVIPNHFRLSTRSVLAWDSAALAFIIMAIEALRGCDISRIRRQAARQDEGRGLILALAVVAAAAAVFAIGAELSLAKGEHGLIKIARIALAFSTIAVSWFFVHLIFALHYAHEFYSADQETEPEGGLLFPGSEAADYWDFLHFAVIIGVACQTADIAFTSKSMRRTGTAHGLISFAFNTVVLALTINLLAGLF